MEINNYIIKYTTPRETEMELTYRVASARVSGKALFTVSIEAGDFLEKAMLCAVKCLRSLKKQGRIQLFERYGAIVGGETVEAVYLLNKYPTLASEIKADESLIVIKL